MNFDVESHLGAAERSVSLHERDGRPASGVTITRRLSSTVEDLWDAVTNGDRIPRWAMPISGDLELGGRYQLEGNAGGEITECERLSHFSLTWEFAGDLSWVDVRVMDDGAGCAQLSVTHTAHLSPHWDQFGPGAVGVGWELALAGLALHLERPDEPKPDEMEFVTSRKERRSSQAAARRGARLQSRPVRTLMPRARRRVARPRSTLASRPSLPDALTSECSVASLAQGANFLKTELNPKVDSHRRDVARRKEHAGRVAGGRAGMEANLDRFACASSRQAVETSTGGGAGPCGGPLSLAVSGRTNHGRAAPLQGQRVAKG